MHLLQLGDHALPETHFQPDAGPQSTSDNMRLHVIRFIEVPRVDYEKLSDDRLGEPFKLIHSLIESARERQRERFSRSAITQWLGLRRRNEPRPSAAVLRI